MMTTKPLITGARIAVTAALLTFGFAGLAAGADTLTAIGHKVHQRVLTDGKGGDIAGDWSGTTKPKIEWITFNVQDVHERLFREASLGETGIDIGFVANRYFRPQMANLFEPLDDHIKADPIKDFDEIPKGMLESLTYGGKLYGIPFRHATSALHYNETLLKECGLNRPPKTFEEVLDYARKLTYTRADGTRVHGFALDYRGPAHIADVARPFGGDFLTLDFKVRATEPGMIKAMTTLRDFYKEGVLPKTFLNFKNEDVITFMQQGRLAMAITVFGRTKQFNDPAKSKFPGQIKVMPVPASSTLEGYDVAPEKTEFWAAVIPRNSKNKDLAWDFIRFISDPENTIRAALNGNGPVRPSAYDDPRVKNLVPYAAEEQKALAVARPPLPGWENSAKVEDIFIEQADLVLLGRKSPEEAMQAVKEKVEPLLPN